MLELANKGYSLFKTNNKFMTGSELKTFTESLLDGVTIEETFFYQLANIAKTKIEAERPWRQQIFQDTSN